MESNVMSLQISETIERARALTKRKTPAYKTMRVINDSLRQKRKQILCSFISLQALVKRGTDINDEAVDELSLYLAKKAILFWDKKSDAAETFCFRFFVLAIFGIASGKVGNETIDDIIQLANTMARSRDVLLFVLEDILPDDMIGEMFDFIETYTDEHPDFFCASFEDAVIGALAVFLGAIEDPALNVAAPDNVMEE